MKKNYRPEKINDFTNEQRRAGELDENEGKLLFLVPLVQVAWAHGAISPRERQLVFEAARAEGIDERDALIGHMELAVAVPEDSLAAQRAEGVHDLFAIAQLDPGGGQVGRDLHGCPDEANAASSQPKIVGAHSYYCKYGPTMCRRVQPLTNRAHEHATAGCFRVRTNGDSYGPYGDSYGLR